METTPSGFGMCLKRSILSRVGLLIITVYINFLCMEIALIFLLTISITSNIAIFFFLLKRQDTNKWIPQTTAFTNTVVIGKVENISKDESWILKSNPVILSIIVKLIDFKVAYYADNFVKTDATDAEMRIYQGYINALVAFRGQLSNLVEEGKKK